MVVLLGDNTWQGEAETDEGSISNPILGDILALSGAIMYALYTVVIKRLVEPLCEKYQEKFSMTLFFGWVGIMNFLFLWPFTVLLNGVGFEPFSWPSNENWGFLLLNALLGTVLSDVLWAKAVVLTTPVIATVVLSLEIPLSMAADAVFHAKAFTWAYYLGCTLLMTSLIVVNINGFRLGCKRTQEPDENE